MGSRALEEALRSNDALRAEEHRWAESESQEDHVEFHFSQALQAAEQRWRLRTSQELAEESRQKQKASHEIAELHRANQILSSECERQRQAGVASHISGGVCGIIRRGKKTTPASSCADEVDLDKDSIKGRRQRSSSSSEGSSSSDHVPNTVQRTNLCPDGSSFLFVPYYKRFPMCPLSECPDLAAGPPTSQDSGGERDARKRTATRAL